MKPPSDATLQRLIRQKLTYAEFEVLCKNLGIDPKNIPGDGLIGKVGNIHPYMRECGLSEEQLLYEFAKLKPNALPGYEIDDSEIRAEIIKDPSLINVPPQEVGTRIVHLEVSDAEAKLLLDKITNLYARIEVLPDPTSELESASGVLEQAAILLRRNPEEVIDWPLLKAKAENMIGKSAATVSRAELLLDERRAQAASVSETEEKRALDEGKISWMIPLIILIYTLMVLTFTIYGYLVAGEKFVIPVIAIPIQILAWSSIGSLSALIYRYYKRQTTTILMPEIRLNIGRFWIGLVAGVIFYFAIRSSLFVLSNQIVDLNNSPSGQQQILWVLTWLIAFSDVTFETVIKRISGNVIGESDEDILESVGKVVASEIADTVDKATSKQTSILRSIQAHIGVSKIVKTDNQTLATNTANANYSDEQNDEEPQSTSILIPKRSPKSKKKV